MQIRRILVTALGTGWLAFLSGCGTPPPAPGTSQGSVSSPSPTFFAAKLAEIDDAITDAIARTNCPGAVLWLERLGTAYHRAYGNRAIVPTVEPMTEDTLFDAASLTKVIACTPAVMLLIERGQIELDVPVCRYLPEFTGDGREAVTIRHLMTHTSGLRPDISLSPDWSGREAALKLCYAEKLTASPGHRCVYSDTGPILLGEVVRRLAGKDLDVFLAAEVYGPLKMTDTGFHPSPEKLARVAPTEVENGRPVRGIVHDPRSRRMGGVAGHAGLFTTAADLARFSRMLLNEGELEGVRVFKPETVRLMTSVQTPPAVAIRRGLGWDIDSGYAGQRGDLFPIGGYGHTGWTGTSIWIDPFSRTFVVLLTNRNHPTEDGNVIPLRRKVGTLAAQAVVGFNFSYVPGALPSRTDTAAPTRSASRAGAAQRPPSASPAPVLNGIDVLARQDFAPLRGLRVGLITNHTGHDRDRRSTIDLLARAAGVKLVALFSPEHGIRGALDETVGDSTDEPTGLPVYSLYGPTRQPTPDQLRNLDALVFDLQDIGARFYTYISTMGLAMEAAAKAGKRFIVLDRVNPIGGMDVEGPLYTGEPKFTAFHRIPVRHGMTVGELARLFNAERGWNGALTVVSCEGWTRAQWFDETGLPWTNPSPNMRSLTAATLYPGVCLLEACAVSVGRGTETPFEIVGAPYVRDREFAEALNGAGVAGVRFVPVRFTPDSSVFKGQACGGARILLVDRDSLNSVDLGLALIQTLQRLYSPQFNVERVNNLLFHRPTIDALRAGKSRAEIAAAWADDLAAFRKRRTPFLLYP